MIFLFSYKYTVNQSVCGRQHPALGQDAVVEEFCGNPLQLEESSKITLSTEPLQIPVDPLLVQSINRSPNNLEQSVLRSHVTFSADEEKGMLVFSPTRQAKPSWRQECQEHVPQFISENLTKEEVSVPKEAAAQALSIALKLEKEHPGLRVDPSNDGTVIILAGETSNVLKTKAAIEDICSELVTDIVSVILSPEDFDFIEQVKQNDLPTSVECEFDPSTFQLSLKGPVGAVTKFKNSMEDFSSHADSPVMLDPLVTEFFKSPVGRGKLEKFLQDRQCHVALHFSQLPNLTLHLLSDRKETSKVKAVIAHIPHYFTSQSVPIPDAVVPIISDMEDFNQLCQAVESEYGVLIKHIGHEVSAAGHKMDITSSLAKIKTFLDERASPLPPSEMKVGTLVTKSLQQSPDGVKKCLLDVSLEFDTGRGILRFTPLHYLPPGWEEALKRSVSEYIKGNVAEVQKYVVPEKAYQDVMTQLYASQQDDNTFVFQYPPQTTSLSFAGETSMVKATEARIAQICANYSFKTEEVPLKPEEFEFLSQLKMQDLINKSRSVEIEPVSETHSLVLSGPTKALKAVKDAIPTLTAHASVEVELDQAIVQFLASEKGKDKLFNILRDKRCDKCAIYISEPPLVKLLLLCSPKNKKAIEKVSETILECTSMESLKIPELLLPVLSELPEFLREVKRLEKETLAVVSVKEKEIIVAGFKDGVSQVTETLSAFVKVKMSHFQPIQISIDPMIAKCIQENPAGLDACMSSIHVKCTLKTDKTSASVSVSPTRTTESDWKKECKKLLESYIDREYLKEKIEIPKAAANSVFPILVSTQQPGKFDFKPHADGSYAIVAGERSVVETVQENIRSICNQTQTSETIPLNHRDYDFFTQVVQHKLGNKATIKCSAANHSVTLSGSVHEVSVLKKSIKDMVQHSAVPAFVDEAIVHFIHTDGKKQFENVMKRKNLDAAIHFNMSVHPPTLELLCNQQSTPHVQEFADSFPEKIETASIPLPTTVTTPPVSQEFSEHCQHLCSEKHVSIQPKEDTLQICGFKDTVGEVKLSLETFIKKTCTVKKSFPVQKGIWRLFRGPMKQNWVKIESSCKDSDVLLTQPTDDEGKIVIRLKGDKTEVQKVIQAMNHLVRSVIISKVPLVGQQIRRYFSGEESDGGMKIPAIERNAKVCIEMCIVGEDMDTQVTELGSTTHAPPKIVKECTAEVVDMKRITVYVGDITEFRADVIVNAANEDLKHIGGVADAILKKGGQEIQDASDDYVASHGKLSPGEVWLSGVVGRLPCLALIHAVGPRWQHSSSSQQLLHKVCSRCLKESEAYNSIALPAISSGVFGCPIDQCANILISATVDFCRRQRHSSLDDINFVLFKHSDVPYFVRALQTHLSPHNVRLRSESSMTTSSSFGVSSYSAAASKHPSAHGSYSSQSHTSSQPLNESSGSEEELEDLEEKTVTVGSSSSLNRVFVQQGSILDVEVRQYFDWSVGIDIMCLHQFLNVG